ncbi:MAG: extracellular solute-binding protein [Nocardioides sp.]
MMRPRHLAQALAVLSLAVAPAACGGGDDPSGSTTITLYTCVSDTTIQPVIETFERDHPGTQVDLFRAPTGELNARIAGDVRSGGLRADVVWGCDPLTMQDYVDQGLVGGWTPTTEIAADYRTDDYVGVAVLYMVAVSGEGVDPPTAWSDLTGPEYADGVAVPDPAVAASALGALGYFADDPDYGTEFYSALRDNGAKQVSTPDDVVTEVAEGNYAAGITTANSAYAAQENGSPIEVTWPDPGAVAVYGPVALAADATDVDAAKAFISYVASEAGQTQMADVGSYPTLVGVPGPTKPADASVVAPDWAELSADKVALLAEYQQIFGG